MKLWRKVAAALKDKNSVYLAKLSRKTDSHNPELEAAIIRATSHDESFVDYKNAQRVFNWARTSPTFLQPLICVLSARMERTHNWVVALKGLMLMHGVFCCKIPATSKIGRLPFDLSNFEDRHIKPERTWEFSAFVRAYFAFLDQLSFLLNCDSQMEQQKEKKRQKSGSNSMVALLEELQQLQALLDMLLQIKPYTESMYVGVILEAMDCIIIEIFDVYSRICNGVTCVLKRIFVASGKVEAALALRVLHKATTQGEELSSYFEFCREIGVLNAKEFPRIEQIPEEDIRDLEKILNGESDKREMSNQQEDRAVEMRKIEAVEEKKESKRRLKAIISDKWVVFDDELKVNEGGGGEFSSIRKAKSIDSFRSSRSLPRLSYNDYSTNSNRFLPLENLNGSQPLEQNSNSSAAENQTII